jgi:hypothetical protein
MCRVNIEYPSIKQISRNSSILKILSKRPLNCGTGDYVTLSNLEILYNKDRMAGQSCIQDHNYECRY